MESACICVYLTLPLPELFNWYLSVAIAVVLPTTFHHLLWVGEGGFIWDSREGGERDREGEGERDGILAFYGEIIS